MQTTFTVAMPRPETHLYEIEMVVAPFPGPVASFDLVMPVWAPGSYAVRDFARNVRDLSIAGPDGALLGPEGLTARVGKIEKSRWRVEAATPTRGPFTVTYRVYANELTVRTSHLDSSHGYGNGTNLFFYVDGRKDEPQRLSFRLPPGWKTSIALEEAADGSFLARGYDELVDSPFECGTHRTFDFDVRGIPHTLALWGRGNEDPERLVRDLTKIVDAAASLFGGLPYERYLFLVHAAAGAGGGLEHRASQSCGVGPWKFKPEKSYREVLYLFSHELFHAWNVKRIRPATLGPFDYTREVHTRDLWAMEGITSYYEGLLLVRAGLVSPQQVFEEEWAKALKAHLDTPGARVQSVEEASFDAWIRLYRPDENSPNVSESYYRRGALLGLALDLEIRRATSGGRSLDDVLRLLWDEWGSRDAGYPEGLYETVVSRVAGRDLSGFFARFVRGTETPDFAELLPAAGLVLAEKPDKDDDAPSGDDGLEVPVRADFGWKTKKEDGKLLVSEVYAGRAAYECGVSAGDELVALDDFKADEDQLKRVERDARPGTPVKLHVFRRGLLSEISLVTGQRRAFSYEFRPDPGATEDAKRFFTGWLEQPYPEKKDAKRGGADPVSDP